MIRVNHVMLMGIWMGNGMALTPSRSHPGEYHTTDLAENFCTCEDFQISKTECWHMKQLKLIQEYAKSQ